MLALLWVQLGPTWPQGGAKLVLSWAELGPTWGQLGAKLGPRWSKMAPSWPRLAPSWPKMGQLEAQVDPRWPKTPPDPRWPKTPQDEGDTEERTGGQLDSLSPLWDSLPSINTCGELHNMNLILAASPTFRDTHMRVCNQPQGRWHGWCFAQLDTFLMVHAFTTAVESTIS